MKNIKRLLFCLLIVFISVINVSAEEFVPHASLGDFDGEYLIVNLWYAGADVSEIEHTIKYDYNLLEINSVYSDTYGSNVEHIRNENNYAIDSITAISQYDYYNTTYTTIKFRVKDDFDVKKSTYIVLDDYVASSNSDSKYKSSPLVITIRRESTNSVYFYQDYYDNNYKLHMWLNDHVVNIIIIVVVIIGIIALFLITPTHFGGRKKVNSMSKKVEKSSGKKSIEKFDLDPDKIQEIGRKKKEEPNNKLELGEFNPFENNKKRNK